ncbi:hypothetical protein [Arthrobacter sp. NPDC056493]|uniref:hypothetical protein n=1 Tax=Arthrobacter sp. NPDC056493 TaxID=3345839 RepID=UPI003671EB4B
MNSSRTAKWLSLAQGDVITFSRQGRTLWGGVIDDRTEDGHIIWVTDEVGTRRLVHSQDEYDFAVTGNVYFRPDRRAGEALASEALAC